MQKGQNYCFAYTWATLLLSQPDVVNSDVALVTALPLSHEEGVHGRPQVGARPDVQLHGVPLVTLATCGKRKEKVKKSHVLV